MTIIETSFQDICTELDICIENMHQFGCELLRASNYDDAESLLQKIRDLKAFQDKVNALNAEWCESFSNDPAIQDNQEDVSEEEANHETGRRRMKYTRLLVKFADGTIVAEKSAAMTFAKTLEIIGFDRVASANIVVNSEDLIGNETSKKYNDTYLDGVYVRTHSSTNCKKKILEKLANEFGLNLEVTVI